MGRVYPKRGFTQGVLLYLGIVHPIYLHTNPESCYKNGSNDEYNVRDEANDQTYDGSEQVSPA